MVYEDYTWLVMVFSRENDRLVSEHVIRGLSVDDARSLFKRGPDDDMFDMYLITPDVAEQIEERSSVSLDMNTYEYYAELRSNRNLSLNKEISNRKSECEQ
jgi:(2Fe-2S) ferredoxin